MAITGLHILTPSTDATSTISYEYFRNEGLKRSENAPLWQTKSAPLGVEKDPLKLTHLVIGYGYDLNSRPAATSVATLTPYLTAGVTITAKQIAYLEALRTNTALALPGDFLDKKIPTRQQVQDAWSNITLASETKATELLNVVAATFESNVSLSLLGNSKERAAVVSATYNVGGLAAMPMLKAALENDDRAEAWFQIRYKLNGGASRSPGIANRRYRESDLVGLFDDPAQLTDEQKLDDAKSAYHMFTAHRADILYYEGLFSPTNVNAGSTAIAAQLNPAKLLILGDLGTNANSDIVNAYQAWIAAGNSKESFLSTKLYLDPGQGNVVDARQYTTPGVLGSEIASNDILIAYSGVNVMRGSVLEGGMGNDLLIGGTGDDKLNGGAGDDIMAGGAGNDTYILDGGGKDTIEDKQGNNKVMLNDKIIGTFYRLADGVSFMSYDGGFSAVLQGGDFIVTDTVTGDQVTLNKDFQEGDFGIHFQDKPADPQTTLDISGDILPTDIDPGTDGIQAAGDAQGNPVGTNQSYEDILVGSEGNDHLQSGELDDNVGGRGGDDWIESGNGSDYVNGEEGNDLIEGGAGADILAGDAANDNDYQPLLERSAA